MTGFFGMLVFGVGTGVPRMGFGGIQQKAFDWWSQEPLLVLPSYDLQVSSFGADWHHRGDESRNGISIGYSDGENC